MKIKQLIIELGAVIILMLMIAIVASQLNYDKGEDHTPTISEPDSLSLLGAMSGTIG